MTDGRVATGASEIDLRALLRALGRSRWLILVPTFLVMVLATAAVNVVSPRYTGETRLLLENAENFYTRPDKDVASRADPQIDAEAVLSQVQLIMSRDVARSVMAANELTQRAEFDPLIEGISPLAKVLVLIGLIKNPADVPPEERVLEAYYDKLKAFAVGRSRVIAIEFESKSPELAAKLSGDIAAEYLRRLQEAKKASATSAGDWLGRTIEPLRQRTLDAENKAEAFRARSGLLVGTNNTTITAQQLAELNTQLSAARSAQAEMQARARLLRDAVRAGRTLEISEVVRDDTVRNLIQSRAVLQATLAQESRTLLPQHPRIKELQAQVGGLDAQIRSASERAARAMENDARAAGARVANVEVELDRQKQIAATANENEVQQRALDREAKVLREQLDGLLVRQRDAEARDADNAVSADARIVSRAIAPSTPSFPKKGPIIFLSTLGTLVLLTSLVLTRELLSGRPYLADGPEMRHEPVMQPVVPAPAAGLPAVPGAIVAPDLPSLPPAPVVGVRLQDASAEHDSAIAHELPPKELPPKELPPKELPPRELPPTTLTATDAPALDGSAFQRILVRVNEVRRTGRAPTLLVFAADPAIGATRATLALGRRLAAEFRTVLVDLETGSGRFDVVLTTRDPIGLGELLTGQAMFGQVIHRDRGSRLHIVPSGAVAVPLGDVAETLAITLDALAQGYEIVLVDAGSVESAIGRAAAAADAVLLVGLAANAAVPAPLRARLDALGVTDVITLPAELRPVSPVALKGRSKSADAAE